VLQQMRASAKWIWLIVFVAFVGAFLLIDTSGLLGIGGGALTPTTSVATVNGRDILFQTWEESSRQLAEERAGQLGRALTLEENQQVRDEAFDRIVADILLNQEYERRGIRVSDAEIQQAAQYYPPPELMQSPELQTDGQFDPEKYRRYLASPSARQQGLLLYLENFYRTEIPRQKLFRQVADGIYLTDARLWRMYRDEADSAQVSFVAFRPTGQPDSTVQVSDAEIRAYYDEHRQQLERPGRAVVSLVEIPRTLTAADSAATLERVRALREEIVSGRTTFEDVARRESADTVSAVNGGLLPPGGRGRFVEPFERAAYALRVDEVSQPVRTDFGYHLIKLEDRAGDTLTLRHVLVRFAQSDSSATRTDRQADELARLAAGRTEPSAFDTAAARLGLAVRRLEVIERQPLVDGGRYIPDVSVWAFEGTEVGETSDLIYDDAGYYLARLDSIQLGGIPSLDAVRAEIRDYLARRKQVEALVPQAEQLATAAAGSTLESAAAQRGLTVSSTPLFNRLSAVPGLGRLNEAIGAAFGLPVGVVSKPVVTDDGVFVLRVNRRIEADSAAWAAQKTAQRDRIAGRLRQQKVQEFLQNLRRAADIDDRRDEIMRANREAAAATS
jgi:parvulin-like peptidyl-prolyl isomerase